MPTEAFASALIVWFGPKKYTFPVGRDVTIGPDNRADIRIDGTGTSTSPTRVVLHHNGRQWIAVDRGEGGIYVDGVRMSTVFIHDGRAITLGWTAPGNTAPTPAAAYAASTAAAARDATRAAAPRCASRTRPTGTAAPRSAPTPVGTSETAARSAPACPANTAGAAPRRSADAIGPAGAAHRPVSPARAAPRGLANPTAATRTAAGLLGPATAATRNALGPATAASSAGTGVSPTPCPAQAEGFRRGADRRDAETAAAAPGTPAARGRADHCAAPAGCAGGTGCAGDQGN